jgi:hypothetical protein
MNGVRKFFHNHQQQLIADTAAKDIPKAAEVANAVAKSLDLLHCMNVIVSDGGPSFHALIQQALERGLRRPPQESHVFVHPEWPWDPAIHGEMRKFYLTLANAMLSPVGYKLTKRRVEQLVSGFTEAYRRRILEEFNACPNPIIVTHPRAQERRMSPECRERTLCTEKQPDSQVESGCVDSSNLEKMIDLFDGFHPEDTIHISGASYDQCLRTFAVQQYILRHLGEFFLEPYKFTGSARQALGFIAAAVSQTDGIGRTRMRMHTVFDTALQRIQEEQNEEVHHVNMQLTGPQTVIIPGNSADFRKAVLGTYSTHELRRMQVKFDKSAEG